MKLAIIDREKLKDYKQCNGCGVDSNTSTFSITMYDDPVWSGSRCNNCGYEIRYKRSKKEIDIRARKGQPAPRMKNGSKCRKCGDKIVVRESSGKGRAGKKYYFTHYLFCNGCKTLYLDERYKVTYKKHRK